MSRFYQKVISLSRTREDFLQPPENIGSNYVAEPTTTVTSESKTTVVVIPSATVPRAPVSTSLWQAEANGALFPLSRVRRVERAQDALTHTEECVYDCLWGPKNIAKDETRLARIGYDRIAKAARITKRNAALIIERLIDKGFIKLEKQADPLHRVPSEYRVMGYKAALGELSRRNRHWVVRSGNGVLFVHPVTVVTEPSTTVAEEQTTTVVAATTDTVVEEQPTTVVATTTHLDNKKQTDRQSSSSALADICNQHGVALDAAAERIILKRCRGYDSTATEKEIAHFTGLKISQLKHSRGIGNLVGVLLTAVPEFFVEPAHELQRYRAQHVQQNESRRSLAETVLQDPQASEAERTWAINALREHAE